MGLGDGSGEDVPAHEATIRDVREGLMVCHDVYSDSLNNNIQY